MESMSNHADLAARDAEYRAPVFDRWLANIGLQGKLILSFMYLLILALGASCWLFTSQSSERVSDIMGEQARQISYALSLASKSSMEDRNEHELKRIGQDLLKTRNILFVSFLDVNGRSIALSSRDPSFQWEALEPLRRHTQALMQVHRQTSPVLGEYLAVMSPVLSVSPVGAPTDPLGTAHREGSRLLGYVVVGLSQA